MRITIADRFRPLSHQPGDYCVLPGTSLRFQIFPTLIRVHDISEVQAELVKVIPINLKGPVEKFTVQLDLEKMCIRVWGEAETGYFRYSIWPTEDTLPFAIKAEKEPGQNLFNFNFDSEPIKIEVHERLSLGNSKAQDWQLMRRRCDMTEVLPILFRLGQSVPQIKNYEYEGTILILEECRRAIILGSKENILYPFRQLFLAGFDGIFSPRLSDTEHQGYQLPPVSVEATASPLVLLSMGATLIRSLFFSYNDQVLDILPALPPEFHCGRLIDIKCGDIGTLHLEWSKKTIRRMILQAEKQTTIRPSFQKHVRQYRLRETQTEKGQFLDASQSISVQAGKTYYFDNFQK